jgi:hypothetical protein
MVLPSIGISITMRFLGAFLKLRKATNRIVMSVRPSARMKQLDFRWTDFHEILYWCFSLHSIEIIQVSLKSNKNRHLGVDLRSRMTTLVTNVTIGAFVTKVTNVCVVAIVTVVPWSQWLLTLPLVFWSPSLS